VGGGVGLGGRAGWMGGREGEFRSDKNLSFLVNDSKIPVCYSAGTDDVKYPNPGTTVGSARKKCKSCEVEQTITFFLEKNKIRIL
jgi:hypothetical protein